MSHKVLITPRTLAKGGSSFLDILRKAGCETILNPYGRILTEDELIGLIPQADGVIVGLDPITARVLEKANRLKVISKYGVGTDNIDINCATRKGVVVINAPGTNSAAVAELAFGLMLDVARRISTSDRQIREGRWESHYGVELWGKTLGIIGTGRTGRELALRARGFAMRILCFDIVQDEVWARTLQATYLPLPDLLTGADFVSLHIPLTEETHHILASRELGWMQSHAIVINTARGELIDERALIDTLKEDRLGGAGLDVWETVPPVVTALAGMENVVLTSHIGAHTREAVAAMGELACRNLIEALSGKLPECTLNPEVHAVRK